MYEFSINYEKPWHIFGFGVDKAATDPGFTFILWMLNQLSHDPQIMYISVGAITYFFIIKTLIQYGRPFELSMLLFLGPFIIMRHLMACVSIWWQRFFLCRPVGDQWTVEIVFSARPCMFIVSFISHHDSCVFYCENKGLVLDDAGLMPGVLRLNRSL